MDGNITLLNTDISGDKTLVNSSISNETIINPEISGSTSIGPGTVFCGKYVVLERMKVQSGEADLYLCEYDGKKFVAKIYRRKDAVKDEVVNKLLSIKSDRVARVCDITEWDGFPVTIMPYYKNGSLQGRKFSYIELRQSIIPGINESLKVLHDNDIYHKDLKPSNIMLCDNEIDVAIIDFGISSVNMTEKSFIETRSGFTASYSDLETMAGYASKEGDYYSLGITIFELFTGYNPLLSPSEGERRRYASQRKLTFPPSMPEDLKNLIIAVTYPYDENSNKKDNPDRRWMYEEVKAWCERKEQIIPGSTSARNRNKFSYWFLDKEYLDIKSLTEALALNWEAGKKELFRGLLANHFKTVDHLDNTLAGICMDAEEAVAKREIDEDGCFFKTLYKMDPTLKEFIWKGRKHDSLRSFGKDLLEELRKDENRAVFDSSSLFKGRCLSFYWDHIKENEDDKRYEWISDLEEQYISRKSGSEEHLMIEWTLAYLLSEEKTFKFGGKLYNSISGFLNHMDEIGRGDTGKFNLACDKLMSTDGDITPAFEVWLSVMEKESVLRTWRDKY